MAFFNKYYQWEPKYYIAPLYDTVYRFLAELETHFVKIDHFSALNELLVAGKNLTQINDKYPTATIISLRSQLPLLLNAGFIRENLGNKTNYYLPEHKLQPQYETNTGPWREVINLSQGSLLPAINLAIEKNNIPKGMSLVIVDDYLDPRLEKINQHYHQSKLDWLLLKLTGERALVGPIFTNTKNSACWQCLHHRMHMNNPLRWVDYAEKAYTTKTLDHHSPPLVAAIPIKYDNQLIDLFLTQLPSVLSSLLANNQKNKFIEISSNNTPVNFHPVIQRPQCSCCGDADLVKRRNKEPVLLQTAIKRYEKDGGVRCISADKTTARLESIISPISGLLSHCHCESKAQQGVNQIYRSGFFQIPRQLSYLPVNSITSAFWYSTMGKGISSVQSKTSALAEGIERLAAQYQGDEAVHYSLPEINSNNYILPQNLTPFSTNQYNDFIVNGNNENRLFSNEKYQTNDPLHWTPVWSLTHKTQRFVPFSFCYAHTPFDDQRFSRFYHNGGAAGNTLEEAVLQGFLEVIERDAIAIWWYNQTLRSSVCLDDIDPSLLNQLSNTLAKDWQYWALDISSDFTVPVIAAIGQHKTTKQFSFGFGCHIDPIIACQRALTELCQITEIRNNHTAPFDFGAVKETDFLFPNNSNQTDITDLISTQNSDICDDINLLMTHATKLKLEVLVLNYTRPDMILHTVKVIIPGSCHLFPYLAAERLYTVPVNMGLLKTIKKEHQLNPQALLI